MDTDDLRKKAITFTDRVMILVALFFIVSLILNYGFYFPGSFRNFLNVFNLLLIPFFILHLLIKFVLSVNKIMFLKGNSINLGFAALFVLQLFLLHRILPIPSVSQILADFQVGSITKVYIIVAQAYMLGSIILRAPRVNKLIFSKKMRPPVVLFLSFITIILTGTLLLLLPRTTSSGEPLDLLTALFTATSATCVTGLIVVPTGTHFSLFGQVVILVMIQIGGLGLMTFTTFFAMVLGGGIGIRERIFMKDILNYEAMSKIGNIIGSILLITFTCEIAGAFFLYLRFQDKFHTTAEAIFHSIFHSISAFCNAGFCLYEKNFMAYRTDPWINIIISLLVVLGGLGFVVNSNLLQNPFRKNGRPRGSFYSIQTRMVLLITAILLAVGTIGILLGEYHHSQQDIPVGGKLMTSFFQSMTARTAGFNTLDIGSLQSGTLFLIVILMFIGASPGSTGGGIKTSTLGILLLSVISVIKRRDHIEIFRKTITQDIINKAVSVIVTSLSVVLASTLVLCFTESFAFLPLLFEAVSAFGTVGLSTGITPQLSTAGKLIITVMMFIGRIGPLTLFLIMGRPGGKKVYRYPEERVMIG